LSNPIKKVIFDGEVSYINFVLIHASDCTGDFRKDSNLYEEFKFLKCTGGVSFRTWNNYEKSLPAGYRIRRLRYFSQLPSIALYSAQLYGIFPYQLI